MNNQSNALLLIGSAKSQGRSTSESLGGYLCDRLVDRGWAARTEHLHNALRTEARSQAMLAAVDAADLVVLAAPLYVDSLPYLVTDALERMASYRSGRNDGDECTPRLLAVINCGFPEAVHNDVAIAICRQFAKSTGMEWAGGLSMGGGGFVHGVPLAEHDSRADCIRRAFDLSADALAAGQPAPDEAVALLAEPAIPPRLYTTIGNLSWYRTAWKQKTVLSLRDQPLT